MYVHEKMFFLVLFCRLYLYFCPQLLSSEGLTLLGVLETHFHADFVSGHYEIGQRTGAAIYFGPNAKDRCKFPMHEAKDNEVKYCGDYKSSACVTCFVEACFF